MESARSREIFPRWVIAALVFGSTWGFLEATLGGYMNLVMFPNKGAIMSGIGMAIMGTAFAIYRKPGMLPVIGIIAAAFKLLDVWFFALPPLHIKNVNPAMSIILESLVFTAIAAFFLDRAFKTAAAIGTGVVAGIISATAWVYFAINIMNAPAYGRVLTTVDAYMSNQAVIQAVFAGVFLPLGYALGERLAAHYPKALAKRSLFFGTSAAAIGLFWGLSALAKLAGL